MPLVAGRSYRKFIVPLAWRYANSATLFPSRCQQNTAMVCNYLRMGDSEALKFAVALLSFVFAMGCLTGYSIRSFISYRHHVEASRYRMTNSPAKLNDRAA